MGGEGEAYVMGVTVGEEELRQEGPEAAPAAGEDAGPRGAGGVEDLEKDMDKQVVGKRAEAVLPVAVAAVGKPAFPGWDLRVALLHGGKIWRVAYGVHARVVDGEWEPELAAELDGEWVGVAGVAPPSTHSGEWPSGESVGEILLFYYTTFFGLL
jgi:hypothetical protein